MCPFSQVIYFILTWNLDKHRLLNSLMYTEMLSFLIYTLCINKGCLISPIALKREHSVLFKVRVHKRHTINS